MTLFPECCLTQLGCLLGQGAAEVIGAVAKAAASGALERQRSLTPDFEHRADLKTKLAAVKASRVGNYLQDSFQGRGKAAKQALPVYGQSKGKTYSCRV